MQKFLIGLLCLSLVLGQQIPITKTYDGISFGSSEAPFVLEIFVDLGCSDCTRDVPIFQEALQKIDFENQKQMRVIYHVIEQAFHVTAFPLAMVFNYIDEQYGKEAALEYINLTLQNQSKFTSKQSFTTLYDTIGDFVASEMSSYKIKKQNVVDACQNRNYDLASRYSWKYSVSRDISGTPMFIANGAIVDNNNGDSEWSVEDWLDFFETYTGLTPKNVEENQGVKYFLQ
ncbi:Thioredoxin-like fold [Pseudocohnilembus persalinus]|uniref:Thioredoxin-like fold n=1 Tax=Pseudocohnilembus persalinus TaxID=266149 RepID=A0A0V0QLU6_PSEPJ|nr:Thioredoxin-like fold [Pseudocohnilembus persalinus]|eukprot:KRX03197.1 Thioredoxin-like fold [Pseudocohnilembus persalinus]